MSVHGAIVSEMLAKPWIMISRGAGTDASYPVGTLRSYIRPWRSTVISGSVPRPPAPEPVLDEVPAPLPPVPALSPLPLEQAAASSSAAIAAPGARTRSDEVRSEDV